MLLRRVIEHVKTQNWTAVALDFFIVVFGVFLGIQLGNWNEQRAFDTRERVFLQELRAEIEEGIDLTQSWKAYLQEVSDAGARSIVFVESETSCENECWARIVDFFHASQFISLDLDRAVFDEMQRIGLPKDRFVEDAVTGFYAQGAGISNNLNERPEYRKVVRELIPHEMLEVLWEACHDVNDGIEQLSRSCMPEHDADELRTAVERIRAHPRIKPTLNHWTSITNIMGPYLDIQIVAGTAAIAAIDTELD